MIDSVVLSKSINCLSTRPETHIYLLMKNFRIHNRDARRLWLSTHGLAGTPTGPLDVMAIIRLLGFVQLDTIRVVLRAHHHIIWSRNQNYREPMLNVCLAEERALFEHFTHDASVLPMEFYPMWQKQYRRMKAKLDNSKYYRAVPKPAARQVIKDRIRDEGPLSTHAFNSKHKGQKQMWSRPPHKMALDYMWYIGELNTSHRKNFAKYYDLAHRVVPQAILDQTHNDQTQIDWLCENALSRIGFGSLGDVQRFWEAMSSQEVRSWEKRARSKLVPVLIETAAGNWVEGIAPQNIEQKVAEATPPTSRLRILNPFDPTIRDRDRLLRLFGFEYRNEMFVPAAQRKWGYYVYPLLEGPQFVGRIELKADRKSGLLTVLNLWAEPKIKWTPARHQKLCAELARLAKMIGVNQIQWNCSPHPVSGAK